MKLKEFTYTKANGDVSKRALIVTSDVKPNIAGYDVTSMDFDDYAGFTLDYEDLARKHAEEMKELCARYDLTHNYRQFIPANMTDVTTTNI